MHVFCGKQVYAAEVFTTPSSPNFRCGSTAKISGTVIGVLQVLPGSKSMWQYSRGGILNLRWSLPRFVGGSSKLTCSTYHLFTPTLFA